MNAAPVNVAPPLCEDVPVLANEEPNMSNSDVNTTGQIKYSSVPAALRDELQLDKQKGITLLPAEKYINRSSRRSKDFETATPKVDGRPNTDIKCNCKSSVDTEPRRISNPLADNVGSPLAKVGFFIAKTLYSLISGSAVVDVSPPDKTSDVIPYSVDDVEIDGRDRDMLAKIVEDLK